MTKWTVSLPEEAPVVCEGRRMWITDRGDLCIGNDGPGGLAEASFAAGHWTRVWIAVEQPKP